MGLFGPIKTELYEIDGGEKYEEMGDGGGDVVHGSHSDGTWGVRGRKVNWKR